MVQEKSPIASDSNLNRNSFPSLWQIARLSLQIRRDNNNNKKCRLNRDGDIITAAYISSTSPVNTTNRFTILDSTEDPMTVIEATTNQNPTKEPVPPPIFFNIIDIQQ